MKKTKKNIINSIGKHIYHHYDQIIDGLIVIL
jgi:hypothetical protein